MLTTGHFHSIPRRIYGDLFQGGESRDLLWFILYLFSDRTSKKIVHFFLILNDFDLITSFIQESAEKHIPSKTSRSTSSVPWITPEIRRKIRRRNRTHAKAKKTGSSKLRAKFESLRKAIKADVKKQHDLYVNNLVGDI